MSIIQRTLQLCVSHFEIGDYVQYGWFRGEIVGLNCAQLQQSVRVCEVLRPAAGRTIGMVQRVPFNLGEEVLRPNNRRCNALQAAPANLAQIP